MEVTSGCLGDHLVTGVRCRLLPVPRRAPGGEVPGSHRVLSLGSSGGVDPDGRGPSVDSRRRCLNVLTPDLTPLTHLLPLDRPVSQGPVFSTEGSHFEENVPDCPQPPREDLLLRYDRWPDGPTGSRL